MSNQRSNDLFKTKQINSIFENMPLISGHLSLKNNSLDYVCCKFNATMKSIDLSYNFLNEHTLCDLFLEVQTSHGKPLEVVLFPQLNSLSCKDLKSFNFSSIEIKDCKLINNYYNQQQCKKTSFPVRYTTLLINFPKLKSNSTVLSSNHSNLTKIILINTFLNEHFVAIFVVLFFILVLLISTFLFCYQHLSD